jgi:hypothetical protein
MVALDANEGEKVMVAPQAQNFQKSYAQKLMKRVVARLRRSAKNRARREYAQAYRIAADTIAHASQ